MIDYLELLLHTPEALPQAVKESEYETALSPIRRDREIAREDRAAAGAGTDEAVQTDSGCIGDNDLSGGYAKTAADGILTENSSTGLPLLRALARMEGVMFRAAVPEPQTADRSVSLSAPWTEREPAADAKAVDLAFQRDSRRYDNGFSLY